MITKDHVEYVKSQIATGVTKESLSGALIATGWTQGDIDEAFKLATLPAVSPSLPEALIPTKPTSLETPSTTLPSTLPTLNQTSVPTAAPELATANMPVVPAVATTTDANPTPTSTQPKKKSRLALLLVLVLTLLLASAGGLAFAYYWQQPQQVLLRMILASSKVQTLSYEGKISADVQSTETAYAAGDYSVNFAGASDVTSTENPKVFFDIDFTVDESLFGASTLGLESIYFAKAVYLRLTGVQSSALTFLDPILNQWVKIDQEELRKLTATDDASITPTPTSSMSTAKMIIELQRLMQRTPFFNVVEEFQPESINGIMCFHYRYEIDSQQLANFIIGASEITAEKAMPEEEQRAIREGISTTSLPKGELWVGKKDSLPYKVTLDLKTDQANGSGSGTLSIVFKDYNQPVSITEPTSYKTMEEFMELIVPESSIPTGDDEKDSDGDGLPDAWEKTYNTDPNKADTDDDGVSDSQELSQGTDPTKK
jgi:hypothetical protein